MGRGAAGHTVIPGTAGASQPPTASAGRAEQPCPDPGHPQRVGQLQGAHSPRDRSSPSRPRRQAAPGPGWEGRAGPPDPRLRDGSPGWSRRPQGAHAFSCATAKHCPQPPGGRRSGKGCSTATQGSLAGRQRAAPPARAFVFFDISAENRPTGPHWYVLEVPTPPSPSRSTARSGRFLLSTLRRLAGLWLGAGICLFCTQRGPGLGPSRKHPPPCPEGLCFPAQPVPDPLLSVLPGAEPSGARLPPASDAPAQLCALPPALPPPPVAGTDSPTTPSGCARPKITAATGQVRPQSPVGTSSSVSRRGRHRTTTAPGSAGPCRRAHARFQGSAAPSALGGTRALT